MIQASVSKSSKMGIRGRSLDIVTTQETVKLLKLEGHLHLTWSPRAGMRQPSLQEKLQTFDFSPDVASFRLKQETGTRENEKRKTENK